MAEYLDMTGGMLKPAVQTRSLYRIVIIMVLLHYNSRPICYRSKTGNSISKLAENRNVRIGIKELIRD
jgi:hypothetical protein